jgi:ankyrin repeat protein
MSDSEEDDYDSGNESPSTSDLSEDESQELSEDESSQRERFENDLYNDFLEYIDENNYDEVKDYLLDENIQDMIDPAANNSESLQIAVELGHEDIVKLLIDDGRARLNANNNQPIRRASEKGYMNIVKMLLKERTRGVDIAANNNEAIRSASANGHLEIIKLLLSYQRFDSNINPGANQSEALYLAVLGNHADIVKYLLKRREIDPTAEQNRVLFGAIENLHHEILDILLKDGRVDPNIGNEDDLDSLMVACKMNDPESVKLLLKDDRVDPMRNDYDAFKLAISDFPDEYIRKFFENNERIVQLFLEEPSVEKIELLSVIANRIIEQKEEQKEEKSEEYNDFSTEILFVYLGMVIEWLDKNDPESLAEIYEVLEDTKEKFVRQILLHYDIDKIPVGRYNFYIGKTGKVDKKFVDDLLAKFPYKRHKILQLLYGENYKRQAEEKVQVIESAIGMRIPGMETSKLSNTIADYLFGKRESELEKQIKSVMAPPIISKTIADYL